MSKNLQVELTRIEDFVMEDDSFNSLEEWYDSTITDLENIAYRNSQGNLITTKVRETNLKLPENKAEGLLKDLAFRFELKGETKRLKEIERRIIGKYKITIVDKKTKAKRRKTLDEFIKYFNENEITNKSDPQIINEEVTTVAEEIPFADAIRRGIIIASIESNKKLSVGGVMATLINYPVKDLDKGMFGRTLAQGDELTEFKSFYEDKTIKDLQNLLIAEFPNFKFNSGIKEEKTYEIEYFFPLGQLFPKIVYYENKTLNTEGEVTLKDLIRKFKVKSDSNLMEIHNWMVGHKPDGPEYPQSNAGSYIVVLTNRPSTQLRLTTGTPWATLNSCAQWWGNAGGTHPEYGGGMSSWTGFTDVRNMNLIAFLFSNSSNEKESNLEDINADWPVVYDDTLMGRIAVRWGYVSDSTTLAFKKEVNVDSYDVAKRIGFSVEPYYGKSRNKPKNSKILTTAIYEILNTAGLSEKYWKTLISPHKHNGATDRSSPPNNTTINGIYGNQIFTNAKSVVNSYYIDEDVDELQDQKIIAGSETLTISEAMSIAKRRVPVEVRLILAQNERVWLYPNAVKELILLKDFNTNMILLNSRFATVNNILQIFDTLDIYSPLEQLTFIRNILISTSFNEIVEQRLINYLEGNKELQNMLITSKIYKKLNNEMKLTYILFKLINEDLFSFKYNINYYSYSLPILEKNIELLEKLGEKIKRKRRGIKETEESLLVKQDFISLSNLLLFAKNMDGKGYIQVINIMNDVLINDKNEDNLLVFYGLSQTSLLLVAVSYILNYTNLQNNKIRNYNQEMISAIFEKSESILDSYDISGYENSKPQTIAMINDFIINNSTRMANFSNRQMTNEGEPTLPYVLKYISSIITHKNTKYFVNAVDKDLEIQVKTFLGLFLILNSQEGALQDYNSLQDIGNLLELSVDNLSVNDNIKLLLLSNTINFENENYLGEKLIRNPVERLQLFKKLNYQPDYLKIFTPSIRNLITQATKEGDKIIFYKDELENYILQEIMNEKLYDIDRMPFVQKEYYDEYIVDGGKQFFIPISTVQLSSYLTNTNDIEFLFNEVLKKCFVDFYSQETFIQRNPLPNEELVASLEMNNFDEVERISILIEDIKLSDSWKSLNFSKFINHLNLFYDGYHFGFANNNFLPDQIQNFILNELDSIGNEYDQNLEGDIVEKFRLPEISSRLSMNKNIAENLIEVLLQDKYNNKMILQKNLANNNNTPLKFLIPPSLNDKNTLLDLFPYEVLLNNQIQPNDFYELYNYVFEIILTRLGKNKFNWNLFEESKIKPLLSIEKSKDLRNKMEKILLENINDLEYWRGGYNIAKKYDKLNSINVWLNTEGGIGGIADYPIMPNEKYQNFTILKWSSDKQISEYLNIKKHNQVSESLFYVEGTKVVFDAEGHLYIEPINEDLVINELFGFIPEDKRLPAPALQYCNDCLERTTQAGNPVKYRFENQEAIDKHIQLKHENQEEKITLIEEEGKIKKWTHECIFVIIDKNPIIEGELRIPEWRKQITKETFDKLINTMAIKIGSLELYDRINPEIPIRCDAGQQTITFTTEDMIRNINESYAWSGDFIDDNVVLICNLLQLYSNNQDMWSNFIITDKFITSSLNLFKDNNASYGNLMLYLLSAVDLNRITESDLNFLASNLNDVDILVLLNNFLNEVKF